MLDEGSNCLTAASPTDRELLARLDAGGDEGAFEALAQRHGRMVFRVCLRLLRDWQAAEDATQAVFLILARRRSGLRAEGNLASWLHGTARQVAWCAVRGRSRRARHEGAAVRARALGAHGLSGRGEGLEDPRLALLDQELASLPVAQRQAVVLRCWDMKEDRKHWETPGIRLHDPEALDAGLETALRGAMVYGEWLFVHGRYDLIALDWRPGQEPSGRGENEPGRRIHWQFKAPEGFEILGLGRWDDLLILCGRKQTLALRVSDGGKVLWSEAEPGEYYAGPYFHRDTVLTVRRGPAEVSFRKPDSGQNLASLPLPGLTLNRRHPLFAGAAKTGAKPTAFEEETEAYPVACAEGALAVVDGRNYYLVDLERRALRWSRKIDKLDPTQANAFRLWIGLGRLWVLKPYYSVLENCVMDLASGELLWRRREGGQAVMGAAPGPGAVGRRAAGLVLHSFVFVDGLIYGGSCESPASSVRLAGLDPASGNVLLELEEKGYADPRAQVGSSWSKDCVVVRVRDGKRLELWQVDLKARRIAQRIWSEDLEGPGSGCAGRMAAQGPYLAISTGERLKFTRE